MARGLARVAALAAFGTAIELHDRCKDGGWSAKPGDDHCRTVLGGHASADGTHLLVTLTETHAWQDNGEHISEAWTDFELVSLAVRM